VVAPDAHVVANLATRPLGARRPGVSFADRHPADRRHSTGALALGSRTGSTSSVRSLAWRRSCSPGTSDMLSLDADYPTRFGGSRLRPITLRIVVPAIGVAVMFAVALVLDVVSPAWLRT
jgi:hypothetical protein